MEFIVPAFFVFHVLCVTSENPGTIQYANIHDNVILVCQQKKLAEGLRWLRDTYILTDGQRINQKNPWNRKFSIDIQTERIQYNLRISNVTADDFGLYLCEMQEGRGIFRQRITLKYKDFLTLSTSNHVSQEIQEKMTDFSTLHTENHVSQGMQEIMTESTLIADESITEIIQTTLPDKEKHVPKNDQYYSYGIFAAGFVVVFLMSVGCNIFIGNYRHRARQTKEEQQKIKGQNPTFGDQNVQESGSVDESSNISSKYETINENEMVMPMITSKELRKQAKILNSESSTQLDQLYLDVIGVDVYSASEEGEIHQNLTDQCSLSDIKRKMLKPIKPYTENSKDDEIASYRCMEETSISPIRLEMCSVNKLINRERNSTKKAEYMNNYFTLDTSDMDNCHSYCTAVTPSMDTMVQKEKQSILVQKRHSCP